MSTLRKYDLRKGDLFVLSWARVRRVIRGSISPELLMGAHIRGILQSRSHNCLVGSHECPLLFTPSCCSECFLMICRGLCVCVLRCCGYVSFGSNKVRPRTFGCAAMGSALLFIFRSRLLVRFYRARREKSASCIVWI